MFSLREFIRKGFLDAIGKMADYQIILNAAGWMEKGVLTTDDLSEIQTAIDNKNQSAAVIPTTEDIDNGNGETETVDYGTEPQTDNIQTENIPESE